MITFIRRIFTFAGADAGKLKIALALSFFEGIAVNGPIFAALFVLIRIADNALAAGDAWTALGISAASIALRWVLRRIYDQLQSGTGAAVAARERLSIGDLFKRYVMGYFTEGNIGSITNTITVDLSFVENVGMQRLDILVNGLISFALGFAFLLWIDWRLSLVSVAVCVLSFVCFGILDRKTKPCAQARQEQSSRLTDAALEYIQEIAVIKSLHMAGEKSQKLSKTIDETRDRAIEFEETFKPLYVMYLNNFSYAMAAVVFIASALCLDGQLTLPLLVTAFLFVFQIFKPAMAVAETATVMRVFEASLDRYETLKEIPVIDAQSKDISLSRFDIVFDHVDFSYERKQTLKDVSFTAKEKSMTALVGASGSGKTTIANLITRFWDVNGGSLKIGGVDVKDMTCDSLLRYVSMVFQRVYLFQDTIENNIKFGKPDATHEQVVEAAKRARCHDFISALPTGYDTMVGEGGSTLSGGERQRISIARAMLKDAPIVLLDEATASVDPDNEKYIQQAISELVRDKTLVVIAHRLSTIKNADQIIVLDAGSIMQRGRHDELIAQDGMYRDLWRRRTQARRWRPCGANG
jgi:ATP-binding cassette subfamily B protein